MASDAMKAAEVLGAPSVGAAITYVLSKPSHCYSCADAAIRARCGTQTSGFRCETIFGFPALSNNDAQLAAFLIGAVAFVIAGLHVLSTSGQPQ